MLSSSLSSPITFKDFLLQIAENDLDWIGYLQRFFGSYLLGNQPKHKIHVFYGYYERCFYGNGKSTLIDSIDSVLRKEGIGLYVIDNFNSLNIIRLKQIAEGTYRPRYISRYYKALIPLIHANSLPESSKYRMDMVIVPFSYRVVRPLYLNFNFKRDEIYEWLVKGSEEYLKIGLDIEDCNRIKDTTLIFWNNIRSPKTLEYFVKTYLSINEPNTKLNLDELYDAYKRFCKGRNLYCFSYQRMLKILHRLLPTHIVKENNRLYLQDVKLRLKEDNIIL
jgi:phage/plasmid-associated DNA primase